MFGIVLVFEQRWGQWWPKLGRVSRRAIASKAHVWGRVTVLLFAKRRAFTEAIAVASAADASALNIVISVHVSGLWKMIDLIISLASPCPCVSQLPRITRPYGLSYFLLCARFYVSFCRLMHLSMTLSLFVSLFFFW